MIDSNGSTKRIFSAVGALVWPKFTWRFPKDVSLRNFPVGRGDVISIEIRISVYKQIMFKPEKKEK